MSNLTGRTQVSLSEAIILASNRFVVLHGKAYESVGDDALFDIAQDVIDTWVNHCIDIEIEIKEF